MEFQEEQRMNIIDLAHVIHPDMPVYPGTKPPQVSTECTIEEHGFIEKKISLYLHTGTHIDSPAHLFPGAKSLDQFPPDRFFGKAFCLNLTHLQSSTIEVSDLKPCQNKLEHCDFLLLRTDWSRFWGKDQYFTNYPVLTTDAALWLSQLELKGLGLDAISVDPPDSTDFPNHKILLKQNWIIIENLTNLRLLPDGVFTFSCFPLKIQSSDGSPVRAAAILE